MYKKFFLLLICCYAYIANAQEIVIDTYEKNGQKGYQVLLEHQQDKVDDFLSSYFKSYGKVRSRGGIYTISNLSRADFPYPDVTLFSETKRKSNKTNAIVWIADSLFQQDHYAQKLNDLWYSFAVDFYRDLVQQEIDESTQALKYAEKQFHRLEKDSLNLQSDIEKNRKEKLKLEEALKMNEVNHTVLLKSIENNANTKDSVTVAIQKIKRLIELQERKKNAIE